MEIKQLKTFQTVARFMNFNNASKVLNCAQSTVSAQIKLLEEELDVLLFDRIGKKIVITDAGQKLIRYSQKMIDIENEAISEISSFNKQSGTISIRVPQSIGTYYLPSVLKEFNNSNPKVGFDLNSCAMFSLKQEFSAGLIDIAFLLADSINSKDIKSEVLKIEPLVLVSNPDHVLTKKKEIGIQDLNNQSILFPKHDCGYKMRLEQMIQEENLESVTKMEFNSIETIKQCVIKGLGITVIPKVSVEEEVRSNKLTILPWKDEVLETCVLMISHKSKWLSPALTSFMEVARNNIR